MCLLVQQTTESKFTDEFLADVYEKNRDGLGVMYAEDGELHIFKCLPANEQDFIDFYRKHAEGRYCVWHARMQTHGDIDFDNCHPYKVTDDIWLAHNGILSTSNDWDKTKSDTWHFIQFFIKPALTANPDLMTDENWKDFVGKLIGGSNKFALVRSDGEIAVINAKSGVNYANAWLSNTYAWSANRFMNLGKTDMFTGYSGYRSRFLDADYEDYYSSYGSNFKTEAKGEFIKDKSTPRKELTSWQVRPYVRAAFNQWMRKGIPGIEQWVYDAPHKAIDLLNYWYDDIDEIEQMVEEDPYVAAEWIADLFETDSIAPALIN